MNRVNLRVCTFVANTRTLVGLTHDGIVDLGHLPDNCVGELEDPLRYFEFLCEL